MKALVLTGVKKFEIQNMPTPQIEPDEVLINTVYAGVCGTDHDLYAGRPGSAAAVPPIVLGHENSGVVAAVGSEVTNVKVGDRVAVDPNIYCGQCEFDQHVHGLAQLFAPERYSWLINNFTCIAAIARANQPEALPMK